MPDDGNWEPGKPLPNAQEAKIDRAKFEKYSMDPNNPKNEGKWEAFEAIGYNVHNELERNVGAQDVIAQLRSQLSNAPASAGKANPFGRGFEVMVEINGPNGKAGTLVTLWQIDVDDTIPRLISNWLKVRRW
jgi:hypothetical protein